MTRPPPHRVRLGSVAITAGRLGGSHRHLILQTWGRVSSSESSRPGDSRFTLSAINLNENTSVLQEQQRPCSRVEACAHACTRETQNVPRMEASCAPSLRCHRPAALRKGSKSGVTGAGAFLPRAPATPSGEKAGEELSLPPPPPCQHRVSAAPPAAVPGISLELQLYA